MGIPDGLQDSRPASYVRRQEEKSYRGLLKFFNRACDATGRPRYDDLWPPLPLGKAASTPAPADKTPARADYAVDRLSSASSTHGRASTRAVSGCVRPPPGLERPFETPQAAATDVTMTVRIQAVWRGLLGRRAATALRLESSMAQATVKVQRWWRAGRRLRPVRRFGLFPAAVEKATEKIVAGQRAWRRLRRRGALALSSTVRSGFMDSEREFLSGREAQVILSESFLRPAVREMLKEPDDYTVADRLGHHWYSALRRLEVLGHGESHKSVDGRPFAVDVQEAVYSSLRQLGNLYGRKRIWQTLWDVVESSYEQTAAGIQSTGNGYRQWLMRTFGCSEATADAQVARFLAEATRWRGFVVPKKK